MVLVGERISKSQHVRGAAQLGTQVLCSVDVGLTKLSHADWGKNMDATPLNPHERPIDFFKFFF